MNHNLLCGSLGSESSLTSSKKTEVMRVVELFAGVGGFRLGLEGLPGSSEKGRFNVVWANQWEPACGRQHAAEIYTSRWGLERDDEDPEVFSNGPEDVLVNKDVATIPASEVPEHDLLCGGFPCQDYSVARTRSGEKGIKGEKGKLWAHIKRIIQDSAVRPKMVFLENVPRLLNSPARQRGLNFMVILNDLLKMGYDVEWRVINASEYGMPQQRRRIFFIAYRRPTKSTFYRNGPGVHGPKIRTRGPMTKWMTGKEMLGANPEWLAGPFATAFPIDGELGSSKRELPDLLEYPWSERSSPFMNAGYAWQDNQKVAKRWLWTFKASPVYEGGRRTLGDVIEEIYDPDYEVEDADKLRMYSYVKGVQKEWRIRKKDESRARVIDAGGDGDLWELYQKCTKGYRTDYWADSRSNPGYLKGLQQGLIYEYTAGAMAYPDSLDKPSRTVVTAEIGKSVSRMRHVIEYERGKYRRLMPLELERLNEFPDDWTELKGISDSRRGFLMGNALVVGVITRLRNPLREIILSGSR